MRHFRAGGRHAAILAAALAGFVAPPAAMPAAEPAANEQDAARSSFLAGGYLSREALPDSLVINPPPPAAGSAAQARDEEASRAGLALRESPRFRLAAIDAAFVNPDGSSVFSCAAGLRISPETTPKIDGLLKKALRDLALATYPTKLHYQRPRPFMVNGEPTCTPDHEDMLRRDGSYPSGHSAAGYGWSLILAQIVPERSARIVARGIAFGDSRRVCNVHWRSDVEQGRQVAAAVVARLHADPAFQADLAAARAEYSTRLSNNSAPDCVLEDAALGHGEASGPSADKGSTN
jgi:acid phosphatase (class A)